MAGSPPSVCPVCGANVPRKAKACPECGACDQTGWNEDANSYESDLPEQGDFDYDAFIAEEFGSPKKPKGKNLFWQVVAVILLCALVFFLVLH